MTPINVKSKSRGFAEELRERIAELEELEAKGAATVETCEVLVDLYEFLDRLDREFLPSGERLH